MVRPGTFPKLNIVIRLRRMLPRSLLGRSLLIILLPLVLLQGVALQFFYGSHLDIVSRRLSGAVGGEIAFTIAQLNRASDAADRVRVLRTARETLAMDFRFEPGERLQVAPHQDVLGPWDDDLATVLRDKTHLPFSMDWVSAERTVSVRVQLADGVLYVGMERKRFYTAMLPLFVLWIVGTALVLFIIAALFMRNQVRALRRLADAVEAFGTGRDEGPIRPEGATEVRQAAAAFNRMQDRLRRFLVQRTEMLAGVSHDLRTPLTRLRLALAMLPERAETQRDISEMTADVQEMERMIGGYLAFARGEGEGEVEMTDLSTLLADIADGARRAGATVELRLGEALNLKLRPDAMKRAITNLVDNASRHARHVVLAARRGDARNVVVTVDDDGPGIPATRREQMFQPFESGATGVKGQAGLGLTIARDIVRAHGGDISLEDSPLGGLRARVRLPV
ncbi:MAG: HAMP domain-containing protein [Acetobacteraceae bacterium]|nr:HAMP domain-containing protein [Acetobacteraceae bacterium]